MSTFISIRRAKLGENKPTDLAFYLTNLVKDFHNSVVSEGTAYRYMASCNATECARIQDNKEIVKGNKKL
jgi:hypothetical protein